MCTVKIHILELNNFEMFGMVYEQSSRPVMHCQMLISPAQDCMPKTIVMTC